jgi:hypothetical protein
MAEPKKDRLGGLVPESMQRAKAADLITLPKETSGTNCGVCRYIRRVGDHGRCVHPKVRMDVNSRMCCIYWDAKGVIRGWKTSERSEGG